MNRWIKNIIILFFAIAYITTSVVSQLPATLENQIKKEYPQKTYLSEISKLAFPQSVNNETLVQVVAPFFYEWENDLLVLAAVTRCLSNEAQQSIVNYCKKSISITLSLTVKDIIFPFHYFW